MMRDAAEVESVERARRNMQSYRHGKHVLESIILLIDRVLFRPIIVPLVAYLPARVAYGVACLHGDLRYHIDRPKREEIMLCLEKVLGEQLNLAERIRTTHDFFRLRSCLAIDQIRISGKGSALARLVEIRGLEHIEAALAAGKGAILCTSHFGSFNCGMSLIGARGIPVTVIGRWASNTFDRRLSWVERLYYRLTVQKSLQRHRHRTNIEPSGQFAVAAQAGKILSQNEVLVIALDAPLQLPADRARGVKLNFLNGQALLLPGVTTIAKLVGAPVLMTFIRRSPDWRHQVLEILPPMSMEGDTVTAFKRCLDVVDAAIQEKPAHWAFWNIADLVTLGLLPDGAIE
jgi:lauroyl/myristoyl acyltransferase